MSIDDLHEDADIRADDVAASEGSKQGFIEHAKSHAPNGKDEWDMRNDSDSEKIKSEGQDGGIDRRGVLRIGALGLAATVAAGAGGGTALAAPLRTAATARLGQKKKELIWATHFFAGVPVAAGLVVGFRDFLDPVGWKFRVLGPRSPLDVSQTLAAQNAALRLNPAVIVATMNDPQAYTANLKKLQKNANYLLLNNTQPKNPKGNGLGIPFVGQDWTQVGATSVNVIAKAAMANGKTGGVILLANCCRGAGGPTQTIRGAQAELPNFNKANGTSFKLDEFVDKLTGRPGWCGGYLEDKDPAAW